MVYTFWRNERHDMYVLEELNNWYAHFGLIVVIRINLEVRQLSELG